MEIAKTEWNEGFKVLRERHTTGETHFPLLVFTLSSLAEAALRSGSRSGGPEPRRARKCENEKRKRNAFHRSCAVRAALYEQCKKRERRFHVARVVEYEI